MNSDRTGVAERLKILADSMGGTAALGRACKMPQRTMANYTEGKTEPRASDIVKIAKASRVRLEWLLTGEGQKQLDDAEINTPTAATGGSSSDQPLPLNQEVLESVITGLELALQQLGKTLDPEEKARVVTTLYSISLRRHTIRMSGGTPLHVDKEFDAGNMSADVADLLRLIAESVRKKR